MSDYTPGTYVKGDVEREASTAREAVALAFDGFVFKAPVEDYTSESEAEEILNDPDAAAIEEASAEVEIVDIPTPKALAKKDNK